MVHNSYEGLLADGCTTRMAEAYLATLDRELASPMFDAELTTWAHERGFFAESASAYGLSPERLGDYLSDYDYARLWPLNAWQRIWINDKLTLKYCLAGSPFDRYLPRYYYYTKPGGLMPLVDSAFDPSPEGLANILREVGEIACKPCNGAEAKGFHRLSYDGHDLLVDSRPVDLGGLAAFAQEHPNYVLTEFIRPCAQLAAIDPLIHTLRIFMINPDGTHPAHVAGYLRFALGADKSGDTANYTPPTEADICSFNVAVDLANGRYGSGRLVYANRVVSAPAHPDSGAVAEGTLPFWEEILQLTHDVALRFGPLECLGFDLGLTEGGPRIIEINSHTGIKYLQLFTPLMSHPVAGPYLRGKLEALEALGEAERARRAATQR